MDRVDITLLELIKQSQFNTSSSSCSNFDFYSVYQVAEEQSVVGLVLSVLKEDKIPDEYRTFRIKQQGQYIRYLYYEDQIKTVFDANKIPFVVIKGNAVAYYYKEPFARSMGDIDLLVSPENFTNAKTLIEQLGYSYPYSETGDNRHVVLSKDGIVVELHKRFSHDDNDIEEYLCEGLNNRESREILGYEFPILPRLANGLVLLEHMREHLKSGLGLRQIIDWMMYVNAELDDDFWHSKFKCIVRDRKLEKLAIVSTKMCQMYLGLNESITWCNNADCIACDELLDYLFSSGNFGRKQGTGADISTVTSRFMSEGIFRRLQRMGEYNWLYYHKHKWVKPFCWIYQGIRYARKGIMTGRSRKQLTDDLHRAERRYELLKKLGIE